VAAALASLLLGAALSGGLAAKSESGPPAPRSGASSQTRLAGLPAAAQGPISAALGAVDRAYWVSASGAGLQAVSRSQALHVRFDRSRVALSAGTVQLGLSLRAMGDGRTLTAVGAVSPSVRANRVTYARAGLSEWYVNGPQGLEQGFTIPRSPSAHAAGPLTLSMALSGEAHASLAPDGHSITFSHAGSSALRYTGLTATDATGRTLHSWLELNAGRVELRVDTRGARYPLAIDPLIQQGEKLTAGDGVRDLTGFSVALSADGNTALIGAPSAGVALVFTRSGSGSGSTWTPGPKLVGSEQSSEASACIEEPEEPEEEASCGFGSSVSLSADGNTALIGGPRDNGYVGAAWVFTRSSSTSTWSQQGSKLTGSGEIGHAQFGRSVALSADGATALIGGPFSPHGTAWVFTRAGSVWTEQGSQLTGGEESRYFGRSVALSGDGAVALVGAPGESSHVGAAWVFTRAGSTWIRLKLNGEAEESGEGRFGFSVALSSDGETALIGGRSDDSGAGAAWVFTPSGSTWAQRGQKLTGGGEEGGQAKFGYSVALSSTGETALIGGRGDSDHHGAAWLFAHSGGVWTQQDGKLTGHGEIGTGNFGASVALSADGETALMGGPTDNSRDGAAWAFTEQPVPTVTSVTPNEGPTTGETGVIITGTRLDQATTVQFGEASAGFKVKSPTEIEAVSPPGKGKVDVIVSSPAGASPSGLRDQFTYVSPKGGKGVRPAVTNASPGEGPTAGGTVVTISGTNLTGATAVTFGSTGAKSFTVISATEVTAVSPARPPETVNLTVTTPAGTSPVTAAARFAFVEPRPTTTGGGGVAGTSANVTPGGGVLGFGPFVVPSCTIALRGKTISVQSYKRASVKLSWAGVGTCSGRLKLTVKTKISHPKRGQGRFKTNTIGAGAFSIAPGSVRTVRVNLNALGRSLLEARHGRLNASIAITKLSPGPAQARTASVRLALQKPHKAKQRKK
jgi:hypothetical protein